MGGSSVETLKTNAEVETVESKHEADQEKCEIAHH